MIAYKIVPEGAFWRVYLNNDALGLLHATHGDAVLGVLRHSLLAGGIVYSNKPVARLQ